MSGGLEKSLFNLKASLPLSPYPIQCENPLIKFQFTAKQLSRQAAKAGKDETAEKNKLKKVRSIPFPPQHSAINPNPNLKS